MNNKNKPAMSRGIAAIIIVVIVAIAGVSAYSLLGSSSSSTSTSTKSTTSSPMTSSQQSTTSSIQSTTPQMSTSESMMSSSSMQTSIDSSTSSASQSCVAIAESDSNFSTLVSAIQTAGLASTLSGTGPFTIFAPTNAAFSSLPTGVLSYLLSNKTALTQVLEYHVVSGDLMASQVISAKNLTTLEGGSLSVSDANNTVKDRNCNHSPAKHSMQQRRDPRNRHSPYSPWNHGHCPDRRILRLQHARHRYQSSKPDRCTLWK